MSLVLMYITNDIEVAKIAEKYGVERVWIDLEIIGKEERQRGMNTVKSNHTIADIKKIKPILNKSELLVRINPWNSKSKEEIEMVIESGADIIMLPMWKTAAEVENFINVVNGRCKTVLLLETKEAEQCLDSVLQLEGIDEIHIGLNDLHISYGLTFMFELLSNATVERICNKIKSVGLPYGFGGIAKLGCGLLPAEKIIMEHYRLGSTRTILSRSFCDSCEVTSLEEMDMIFRDNMERLQKYEMELLTKSEQEFYKNQEEVKVIVQEIVGTKEEM